MADTCVYALAGRLDFSTKMAAKLQLGVAEWLTNVIKHGYRGQPGHPIQLTMEFRQDSMFLEIVDQGVSFTLDPLQKAEPVQFDPLDLDNLPESGWGLYLIKNCVDKINYRHAEGANMLTLIKYYGEA